MIGVFDSGVGGYNALSELRRLCPLCDLVYLADRGNAPYGTKTKEEVLRLVKSNLERLRNMGAYPILIACCTASTVYGELSAAERRLSVPIIAPGAEEAAKFRRITVIATERTVSERAFSREIHRIAPEARVTEIATQHLVALVEGGARDGYLTPRETAELDKVAEKIRCDSPEALVLGCTHFSHLEAELSARLPNVRIISPARIGARELLRHCKPPSGSGRIIYTE